MDRFFRRSSFSLVISGLAVGVSSLLAGCGASSFVVIGAGGGGSSTSFTGVAFTATVQAGTQAVSGAAVQLFAAGTTGNGSAAKSLSTGLTTDATGNVSITAGYVCPASASQLYLVSTGGKVGTASSSNANLVMLSAVGTCSAVVSGSKTVVNEATTVASVVALLPFYATGGVVGASATNTTGIANAFATSAELVNPGNRQRPRSDDARQRNRTHRSGQRIGESGQCVRGLRKCLQYHVFRRNRRRLRPQEHP